MLAIELPKEVEQHFQKVVQTQYHGDVQEAIVSLLRLHDQYGWKKQFRDDVESVRAEVRQHGGISEDAIDEAIATYRRRLPI